MAVPGLPTSDAIALFSRLGLDGIELVTKEGQDFHLDVSDEKLQRTKEAAEQHHLPVVTITPYMWQINHPDANEREEQVKGLERAVDIAEYLGALYVRAYGGSDKFGSERIHFDNTVASLRTAGAYAAQKDITIVVENHPGTLTPSGKLTAEMVKAVGRDNVKALFDPANALHASGEDPMVTLEVQKDLIGYVHCKDYYFDGEDRHACAVGQGIVQWKPIVKRLVAIGYDGYISFEYEKMWYPEDLEDAEFGLPICMNYIRTALDE